MANTKLQPMQKKGERLSGKSDEKLDGELSELCKMMKLMSERDVDSTLVQVLKTMLIHSRARPLGGSELSKISGLNRITVIHHMKRLESAGFVAHQETKYVLRVSSAEGMLLEFRKEMERTFAEMDELAREIDSCFENAEHFPTISLKSKKLSGKK